MYHANPYQYPIAFHFFRFSSFFFLLLKGPQKSSRIKKYIFWNFLLYFLFICGIFLSAKILRALHESAAELRSTSRSERFSLFPCFFHHNESKWGLPMPENRAFRWDSGQISSPVPNMCRKLVRERRELHCLKAEKWEWYSSPQSPPSTWWDPALFFCRQHSRKSVRFPFSPGFLPLSALLFLPTLLPNAACTAKR